MGDKQIIGSIILAVKAGLVNPESFIKRVSEYDYTNINPEKWYPIEMFWNLTDYIEKNLSTSVLRNIGTQIIPNMKNAGLLPNLTPKEYLASLNDTYISANRGTNIGSWKVIEIKDGHAIIENTTMQHCILEEGVVFGGIKAFGGSYCIVKQTTCVLKGDSKCTFDIKWK